MDEFPGAGAIDQALAAVGDLLAARGARIAVIIVGGAALNLLGIVSRSTGDVDVIALADRDAEGRLKLRNAEPFPAELQEASPQSTGARRAFMSRISSSSHRPILS